MKNMHNCIRKKILATLLVCGLMAGILPFQKTSAQQNTARIAGYGLSNPVVDSSKVTTWDCIYFGHYWQNDTNGDGLVNKDDDKEPIKWRVLSVTDDNVFLLSDQNLDQQVYKTLSDKTGVTWETSTIRSWLNGYGAESNLCGEDFTNDNFLSAAFNASEQAAIVDTKVAVNDNTMVYPDNGNDTMDKVYLLSASEIMSSSYGFESTWNNTKTRESQNTAYISSGGGNWWLRTIVSGEKVCYIDASGRLWRSSEAAPPLI
ncbi:MAG: hypothetical protein HFG34_03015 [Eubacterium sp.]|nr:hypothetical protein [Eubacterium sp.]